MSCVDAFFVECGAFMGISPIKKGAKVDMH